MLLSWSTRETAITISDITQIISLSFSLVAKFSYLSSKKLRYFSPIPQKIYMAEKIIFLVHKNSLTYRRKNRGISEPFFEKLFFGYEKPLIKSGFWGILFIEIK
jgi:hypothetical protein